LVNGFDYKVMAWADTPAADADLMVSLVPADDDAPEPETLSPAR
jgi:hypothetical protein